MRSTVLAVRRRLLPLLIAGAAVASPAAADQPAEPLRLADGRSGGICAGYGEVHADDCEDPLLRDDRAAVLASGSGRVGGVVPAAGAEVEVRFADGRTIRARTSAPAGYSGRYAGRIAVFDLPAPDAGRLDGFSAPDVLVHDARGALIGLLPGDGVRTDATELLRSTAAGARARLQTWTTTVLRPTALALDRRVTQRCLGVVLPREITVIGREDEPSSSRCSPARPGELEVDTAEGCAARAVYGLAPDGARLRLVLGDGRRRAMRTAPLAGGGIAFLSTVAGSRAVRRLEVATAAGVRRIPVGLPPSRSRCGRGDPGSTAFVLGGPPRSLPALEGERELLAAAGHRLRAADTADGELCLALDDTPFAAHGCAEVGRSPGAVAVTAHPLPGGATLLGGISREGAPAVRIRTGATARTLPTSEPAAPGAYAGRLRAFLAVVERGTTPTWVEALGAHGRRLDRAASARVGAVRVPSGVRRLGAAGGGLVAWGGRLGALGCWAVTGGGRPAAADLECRPAWAPSFVLAGVPCAGRRIVVHAVLPGRRSALQARTARGRTMRARRLALGGGQALYAVALPAGAALREVVVTRAGRRTRSTLRLPAAAAQCGYTGFAFAGP